MAPLSCPKILGAIQKLGVIQSLPLTQSTSKSSQCSLQNPHQLHLCLSITSTMPSSGLDNCNNFPVVSPLSLLLLSSQACLQTFSPLYQPELFKTYTGQCHFSISTQQWFPTAFWMKYTLSVAKRVKLIYCILIMPIPACFKHWPLPTPRRHPKLWAT